MNLIQSIQVALRGLITNKMRSALTMLGIIIGITAVISLTSIGTGVESQITSEFESMGTNLLFVSSGASTQRGVSGGMGSANTLTLEDSYAIADPLNCPSVAMVAPETSMYSQVIVDGTNAFAQIVGITPDYQYVRNVSTKAGTFITEQQMDARERTCVLGSSIAETLFGESYPIGRQIKIDRQQMIVTGVLEEKGSSGFGSMDDSILMPITTMQSRFSMDRTSSGERVIKTMSIQVVNADEMDTAQEQISTTLRQRHDITNPDDDDFSIINQADILESLETVMGTFTIFLGLIAGISLLVGGIGIMNIMLVSVTERIREIGIRKAVGARRRDILIQFLTESAILSLVGGGVGVLAGWGASTLISRIEISGQTIPAVVSPDIVVIALAISIGIGLFFGVYPANRAARLNPIDALRHE